MFSDRADLPTNPDTGTLTKSKMIVKVSERLEIPEKEAAAILERILASIVRAIQADEKVEIRGFGSVRTRQRQPRLGHNPKTGAKVRVLAKRIVFFKPSKELQQLIQKSDHS